MSDGRAFRSLLALDGTGALGPDDLAVLSAGVLAFLPGDEGGRRVLLCDPSLWPPGVPLSWGTTLRCALHWATLAAVKDASVGDPPDVRLLVVLRPTDCIPFLSGSSSSAPSPILSTFPADALRRFLGALPVRVSQIVLAPGPEWAVAAGEDPHSPLFAACASETARCLSEALWGTTRSGGPRGSDTEDDDAATFRVVAGSPRSPACVQLREALQLSVAALPTALGGTWNGASHLADLVRRGLATSYLLSATTNVGPLALAGDVLAALKAPVVAAPAAAAAAAAPVVATPAIVAPPLLASQPGLEAFGFLRDASVAAAAASTAATGRAVVTTVPQPLPDDCLLGELFGALHLLPPQDKADFLHAQRLVPERIARESPPLRFLRFEKLDFWAAARRLAKYWERRHQLFGDRWLLPMNQTGEGTLTRDDINVLRSGFYTLLPNDADGRPVLCGHPSRRGDHSRLPRLRLAFYVWSIVSESEKAQTEGCVVLAVLQKPTLDKVVRECRELVMETLPLKVHRLHLVYPPLDSHKHSFLQSLAPLCLKLFGHLLEGVATVHVADTADELVAKLGQHGLSRRGIPQDLGGDWEYELFHQWCELRMCYEWELPVVGARRRADDDEELIHVPSYRALARSELDEDEQVERKRRLNVLHSRRKRERSRVEQEVLVGQVTKLRTEHARLVREEEHLLELVNQARAMVAEATD